GIERASIAMDHFDLRKMGEIARSTRRQCVVDLEGAHVAAGTNHAREDRCVVSGAASDMHDSLVALEVERVEPHRQTARLSIVQKSFGQNAHEHIVVEIAGMRFARDAVALERKNFPWRRPEVTLTRRFGKRANQQLRAQMRYAPDFSSVASARAVQVLHGSGIEPLLAVAFSPGGGPAGFFALGVVGHYQSAVGDFAEDCRARRYVHIVAYFYRGD